MTYPSLSQKHLETVCTAGLTEDGKWIRIYPVPHRLLSSKYGKEPYHKWQWIEADLEKNVLDDRPESYHIKDINSLKICDRNIVGRQGKKINWSLRKSLLLNPQMVVFENMDNLLELTKQNKISLAVFKPNLVKNVECVKKDIDSLKIAKIKNQIELEQRQLSLFDNIKALEDSFKIAEQIPYSFKYVFESTDGKERKLTITDWELGMLFRNCRVKYGEVAACEKVKEKYMSFAKTRDLYLLLGTQFEWHKKKAIDPYLVVGVFAPPLLNEDQLSIPGF